jgi:hypothetical protein
MFDRLIRGVVAATAFFALAYLGLSLSWPVIHDLPILLYEGFLVADAGLFPYRDFFDFNPPGTVLLFSWLHRATGGAQPAIRLADLLVLAAIVGVTLRALSRFGARAGLFAGASFAAAYLATGPGNSLQREYLCVLPLAVSIALVFRPAAGAREWLLSGLMAGLVVTVKPPLAICWLPLLFHAARRGLRSGGGWRPILAAPALFAAGALPPVALVLLWLDRHQALGAYLAIARDYYPLYTQLDFDGVVHQGGAADLFERYVLKTLATAAKPLAFLAMLGVAAVFAGKEREKEGAAGDAGDDLAAQAATLGAVALCTLVYVPIGGKFWLYHQIPFFYAISLCAALLVSGKVAPAGGWRGRQALILAAALAACLPYAQFAGHFRQWRSGGAGDNERLQVLPLADYLRGKATADDTVLPLDTTDGAVHALYLARRPLYGRFLYDFHFYHHPETAYVAGLRRLFLEQFAGGRPSMVLACASWRPSVKDEEPIPFAELDQLLAADFQEELLAGDCRVLRRYR